MNYILVVYKCFIFSLNNLLFLVDLVIRGFFNKGGGGYLGIIRQIVFLLDELIISVGSVAFRLA